jgi:hypothetical protein
LSWQPDELLMWYIAYGEAQGGTWDYDRGWWDEEDD